MALYENALTVDLEDWYHARDLNLRMEDWPSYEDRIEYRTKSILELLAQYGTKATFFILGCIASKNPNLIREIIKSGHEIGSHSMQHKMLDIQTEKEFREDLLNLKKLLEDISGTPVQMFRAPCWSISATTLWALQILEEEGFICDSSIQPFRTFLSGMSRAPVVPFHPIINNNKLKLVEFPQTVLELSRFRIPFSGGLYLRIMPGFFIKKALKKINSKAPGMIYFHPWETDCGQPKLKVPLGVALTHYYNTCATYAKIESLLKSFKFTKLSNLVKAGGFPCFSMDDMKMVGE